MQVQTTDTPFPNQPLSFCWWIATAFLPGRLLLLLAITTLSTASLATTPWVVGQIIDFLPGAISGEQPLAELNRWFLLLLGVWLIGPILGRLYTFVNAYTLPRLSGQVAAMLFRHTLRQSTHYFQNTFTGALTQRIRRAAMSGPNLVEFFVLQFAQVAVNILVAGFWIALAVPVYGAAFMVFALVFCAVSLCLARYIRHIGHNRAQAQSRVTGQLADALGAADTVHSHGANEHEQTRLGARLAEEIHWGWATRFWLSLMRVAQLVLTAGFMSGLVWFALQRALAGDLSVGTVAMLLTIGLQLAMSITALGDQILEFYSQLGEVKESLDALAIPLQNQDPQQAPPLQVTNGEIRLTDVDYGYPGQSPLFQRFSEIIAPGERVGLVGPSGAGKSTLFRLMTRRYALNGGAILIDGQNIADVQRATLAQQVAEVTQTAELFHRSVRENIRYGRPQASDAEVEAAARAAQCHEFISRMAQGYDTLVGERGVKLSGGERQRIAIARAILKDAPILLLDEATSALDSESEHAIAQALGNLMKGRTVIAIAHRLSTVMNMDRILYLENGEVRETGTHESLVVRQGGYARLWARQVSNFNLSDDGHADSEDAQSARRVKA